MIVAETPQVEAQKTPELLRPFTPLLGLQGRLIMGGDALHPHTQVDLAKGIPEDSLSTTLALMEQASIRERRLATKGVTLDAWKQDVVNKFAALPHPPSGQSPDTFFDKLGINSAAFKLEDAQKLYDRYFSKGNTEKSMSLHLS